MDAPEQGIRVAAGAGAEASAGSTWGTLLAGVDVEVTAELGSTALPLGDIASLVSESVLVLDSLASDPIVVRINGTPYATARLVVVDDEYAVEILEVHGARRLEGSLAA